MAACFRPCFAAVGLDSHRPFQGIPASCSGCIEPRLMAGFFVSGNTCGPVRIRFEMVRACGMLAAAPMAGFSRVIGVAEFRVLEPVASSLFEFAEGARRRPHAGAGPAGLHGRKPGPAKAFPFFQGRWIVSVTA
jgi:hypothetical protein